MTDKNSLGLLSFQEEFQWENMNIVSVLLIIISINESLVEAYSLFQFGFRLRKLADENVSRLSQQKRHRESLFAVSMARSLPLPRVVLSSNLERRYGDLAGVQSVAEEGHICYLHVSLLLLALANV